MSRMRNLTAIAQTIEELTAINKRQEDMIARLSLVLLQYVEQEEIDRILQEEEE